MVKDFKRFSKQGGPKMSDRTFSALFITAVLAYMSYRLVYTVGYIYNISVLGLLIFKKTKFNVKKNKVFFFNQRGKSIQ